MATATAEKKKRANKKMTTNKNWADKPAKKEGPTIGLSLTGQCKWPSCGKNKTSLGLNIDRSGKFNLAKMDEVVTGARLRVVLRQEQGDLYGEPPSDEFEADCHGFDIRGDRVSASLKLDSDHSVDSLRKDFGGKRVIIEIERIGSAKTDEPSENGEGESGDTPEEKGVKDPE